MAATEFDTLFLDSSLRIKRFTDHVTELFSITPNDEGRPITDFANQLIYEDLVGDARNVLLDLVPLRREIHSRSGRWFDVRMRPYRTLEDKIDGVVITFDDVTERRQVEDALREHDLQLRHQKRLVELSGTPIFVWDFDAGIVEWNRGSEELYGFTHAEAVGRTKAHLFGLDPATLEQMRTELLRDGSWSGELHYRSKDGRELTVDCRLQLETFDGRRLVLESTRDVTERKAWEEQQRMLRRELAHRVKNTLTVVQAIAHQTLRNSPSTDEFVARLDDRLAALARAHELLVVSDGSGVDLGTAARAQIARFVPDQPERFTIEGPAVTLPADLVTPFTLVLHELATSAAKHGSLSVATGVVQLTWHVTYPDHQRMLALTWREDGGPPVDPPATADSGTGLIERTIPNGEVVREFRRDGLVCTIRVPLEDGLR